MVANVTITVDLTDDEISQLKEITQQGLNADAVCQAVREYLRIMRLRELKSASGTFEFDDPSSRSSYPN